MDGLIVLMRVERSITGHLSDGNIYCYFYSSLTHYFIQYNEFVSLGALLSISWNTHVFFCSLALNSVGFSKI